MVNQLMMLPCTIFVRPSQIFLIASTASIPRTCSSPCSMLVCSLILTLHKKLTACKDTTLSLNSLYIKKKLLCCTVNLYLYCLHMNYHIFQCNKKIFTRKRFFTKYCITFRIFSANNKIKKKNYKTNIKKIEGLSVVFVKIKLLWKLKNKVMKTEITMHSHNKFHTNEDLKFLNSAQKFIIADRPHCIGNYAGSSKLFKCNKTRLHHMKCGGFNSMNE